ncbi:MAG: hypothetical protein WD717_01270 [Nitrosarchaeum sp.]
MPEQNEAGFVKQKTTKNKQKTSKINKQREHINQKRGQDNSISTKIKQYSRENNGNNRL